MNRWLVLAGALVLAGCGDDAGEEPADAAARDAASGDAATPDADSGDAGNAVSPGVPWTGWHGGDGDCIEVGEPLAAPFCVGDYCLERPSLPLERPLAVDGTSANDIYVLLPDRVLWHRGCSGWAVVPNALPDEARCVSAFENAECLDDVDSEDCAPVCTLVVAGPSSVWLLSEALWRFDGVAFRRWSDAPDYTVALQKVGDDVWVSTQDWSSSPPTPALHRLEDERFVRHAGGALGDLINPPRLYGITGGDVWAAALNENVVLRWDGASWRTVDPPVPPSPGTGRLELAVFGEQDVWLSNGEDVRRWTQDAWELVVERAHARITTVAPGEVWITSTEWDGARDVWSGERFDGSAFHPVEYPATAFAEVAFGGAMWVSEGRGALVRYADGGWQYELGAPDDDFGSANFAGDGETLWMASGDGDATEFWRRGAAGFESVHEERGAYGLYVRAADDVWAYGERDETPRLVHWDGASWQAVSPSPPEVLIDMWSDGTTVLGLSPAGLRSYASPVWDEPFDLPASVSTRAMYVADLDDIWLIGAREMDSAASLSGPWIGHWDGSELQEIAAPAGADWLESIAGTGPDDVWIGSNSGPMRWEGGDWVQMAPAVTQHFDRVLPAGEGTLLLCYFGRVQLWTGSDVEDVAIEPGWCPTYAASPTDFWASYVPFRSGRNDYYYGVWHAQLE